MYITVEISRSGKAFDKCLFHQAALFGILLNYRGKSNSIVNSQSALFYIFPRLQVVEKAYCFLTDAALFTIFFNNRGEAQHTGMPTLLLVEKAYCFFATAALLAIFFNYRGEAQHKNIYLKQPLGHSISTTGVLHP